MGHSSERSWPRFNLLESINCISQSGYMIYLEFLGFDAHISYLAHKSDSMGSDPVPLRPGPALVSPSNGAEVDSVWLFDEKSCIETWLVIFLQSCKDHPSPRRPAGAHRSALKSRTKRSNGSIRRSVSHIGLGKFSAPRADQGMTRIHLFQRRWVLLKLWERTSWTTLSFLGSVVSNSEQPCVSRNSLFNHQPKPVFFFLNWHYWRSSPLGTG